MRRPTPRRTIRRPPQLERFPTGEWPPPAPEWQERRQPHWLYEGLYYTLIIVVVFTVTILFFWLSKAGSGT